MDGSNGCPRDGVYNPPGSAGCLQGEYFIDIGDPYVDVNDNGKWDPGEPFDPVHNNMTYTGPNGVWDADTTLWAETRILYTDYMAAVKPVTGPDAGLELASRFFGASPPPARSAPVTFTVLAAKAGPPPVPATSTEVPLVVTDKNFNLLNSKYIYGAAKTAGTFTAAFALGGEPTTFDAIGMLYRQFYCSTQTPTDVATQCASTCNWAPCYIVSDVSQFSYGRQGALTITGGSLPENPASAAPSPAR